MAANITPRFFLFTHSSRRTFAEEVRSTIFSGDGGTSLVVQTADENTPLSAGDLEAADALIALYSPELEHSEIMFRIIKAVEIRPDMERFLVFPCKSGTNEPLFPPLFHPLRAQQHHLYFYPQNPDPVAGLSGVLEPLSAAIGDFVKKQKALIASSQEEDSSSFFGAVRKRLGNRRTRWLLLSAPLIAALAALIILVAPLLFSTVQTARSPVSTLVQPPEWEALWLDETFSCLDDASRWDESHLFRGTAALAVSYLQDNMEVQANSGVEEASYQLETIPAWPLEELQGVEVEFMLSPLPDQASSGSLTFQLQLESDPAYAAGCTVTPETGYSNVECFIQEPEERVVLKLGDQLAAEQWHTLKLAFNPRNFAFQVFLNEMYAGRAAVPSAEYWRGQNFQFQLSADADNIHQDGFHMSVNRIRLAHQGQVSDE